MGKEVRTIGASVFRIVIALFTIVPQNSTVVAKAEDGNNRASVGLCIFGYARTLALVAPNIGHTHIEAIGRENVDTFVVIESIGESSHDKKAPAAARGMLPYPGNLTLEKSIEKFLRPVRFVRVPNAPEPSCGAVLPQWIQCPQALRQKVLESNVTSRAIEQTINGHCQPRAALAQGRFDRAAACWRQIEQYEISPKRAGMRYDWILSLRTDTGYAQRLPHRSLWPTPNTSQKLVCTEQLGHCTDPLSTNPGVEDQWSLMSRAAAPFYFQAAHILHQRCAFRRLFQGSGNGFHPITSNGVCGPSSLKNLNSYFLGGGLFEVCGLAKPQTRLAIPLLANHVNLCEFPMIPPGNAHIQRDYNGPKLPHFPQRQILDLFALDISAVRALYVLKPPEQDYYQPGDNTSSSLENLIFTVRKKKNIPQVMRDTPHSLPIRKCSPQCYANISREREACAAAVRTELAESGMII